MRLSLILVFLSTFSLVAQDFAPPPSVKTPDTSLPVYRHEIIDICGCGIETHYAGGRKAMSLFINENITLPRDVNWGYLERVKAYVQFNVEKDGSLTNVHILYTNFPDVNENILAVFKKMTDWIPGEERCFAERSRVRVPIFINIR